MIAEIVLYLGFGCVAGLLSGLFGIGGGVVIVPFLSWYFTGRGFPDGVVMIMAVATSLATIVLTSLSATRAHHRRGAVLWPVVSHLAPGILLGALVGAFIADDLPSSAFRLIFAGFMVYVAVGMWRVQRTGGQPAALDGSRRLFVLAGVLIGTLSALLGIGGGTLSVPLLVACRYPVRNAVATSSACGFPIALAGTLAYVALGWWRPDLPPLSLGYVYLPALAGITAASLPLAPVGAALAHRWPARRLKRLLALVLFLIGLKMGWSPLMALS